MRDRYNAFIQRHEIAWELGMAFLAIIYVAVGFALDAPHPSTAGALETLDLALTIVFASEFVSRVVASRDRRAYVRGHWIDALALIPVARGIRLARLARVLRLTRFFAGTYRAMATAERMRGSEGITRVVAAWATVTAICCVAFYAVEAGPNPDLHEPLDALWWGVSTLSTVGYGDITPVTPEGRLVAGALMILGIGLFGAITAIATNTLLVAKEDTPVRDLMADLERLTALRTDQAITTDEFETLKGRLMAATR
jgi:voltage-gated potassium channel